MEYCAPLCVSDYSSVLMRAPPTPQNWRNAVELKLHSSVSNNLLLISFHQRGSGLHRLTCELVRVMRTLAAIGIFTEPSPGLYAHTIKSETLRQTQHRAVVQGM